MKSIIQIASLIATLAYGVATELDGETISAFIKDNENALVKFYAPWCGHCKAMAPAYDEAAEMLAGKVALGKIDVTLDDNKEVGTEYGVQGFPTLKYFHNGNMIDYTGGRDVDGIISWVTAMTGPPIVEFKTKEEVLAAHPDTLMAVYCGPSEGAEYKAFRKAAEAGRGQGTIYASYECKKAQIEMIRKDTTSEVIPKVKTADDIAAFIKSNKLGGFEPIGPENAQDFMELGSVGIDVIYFGGEEDDYLKVKDAVETVAKDVKSTHVFTWIDTVQWSKQAEHMMKTTTFPNLVLPVNPEKGNGFYAIQDFSEKSIRKWVKDILSGDIQPELMSEDIPETNDEPVKIVVGKNFNEIVNDSTDVFLKIMAPWCGHCKTLAPVYDELAEAMQKLSPKTVIAKMDGTANDIPVKGYKVQGFPSLYFKAAGKEPVAYDGGRTVEDMTEYLKTHGTHTFAEHDEL